MPDELAAVAPLPARCAGWTAIHRLAARFPDAFLPCAVGTTTQS